VAKDLRTSFKNLFQPVTQLIQKHRPRSTPPFNTPSGVGGSAPVVSRDPRVRRHQPVQSSEVGEPREWPDRSSMFSPGTRQGSVQKPLPSRLWERLRAASRQLQVPWELVPSRWCAPLKGPRSASERQTPESHLKPASGYQCPGRPTYRPAWLPGVTQTDTTV